MIKSKFFDMGMVECSKLVKNEMENNPRFAAQVFKSIKKYSNKKWGKLSRNDKKVNDFALKFPDDLSLIALYRTCEGEIHIITNRKSEQAGDNCTTILFAHER